MTAVITFELEKKGLDIPALDAAFRSAFKDAFFGLTATTGPDSVTRSLSLFFASPMDEETEKQAAQLAEQLLATLPPASEPPLIPEAPPSLDLDALKQIVVNLCYRTGNADLLRG